MGHETLLRRDETMLVVIDVQEKLLPVIAENDVVLANCQKLLKGLGLLHIPVLYSEQYPKGLGSTIPELVPYLNAAKRIEKLSFSCGGCDAFLDHYEEMNCEQVVLCGIETHICVLQTALDLLDQGAQVHVVADAVGSRAPANRQIALERIRQAGGIVTSTESVLFELLGEAGTPDFKAISRLVRE